MPKLCKATKNDVTLNLQISLTNYLLNDFSALDRFIYEACNSYAHRQLGCQNKTANAFRPRFVGGPFHSNALA